MSLCLATHADAAVTIGGPTSVAPNSLAGCPGNPCTFFQSSNPTDLTYVVPSDGVIVRWRVRTATGFGAWRIRAVTDAGMDTFTGVATGRFETAAPGVESSFAARVPVKAGNLLAVDGPPGSTAALGSAAGAGGSTRAVFPPLVDGEPPRMPNGFGGGFSLQYNADIEPDADGDGFGDQTQDLCPTNPAIQAAECVAPETAISKAPKPKIKTKKRRKKVTFSFTANEPATFECDLDGAGFEPCVSPFKVKLKRGKHAFQVRAIDTAGNVEPTPATARLKIKRRR